MIFVFDIDDTICNNNGRDYENAIPFASVIEKINRLHDEGHTIKLYTSRGMVSCCGDIEKIVAKNKEVLERWLKNNNVAYDELIFGKPLGDLYIDDKAMAVSDFLEGEFCLLNGRSGFPVYRIGNLVKKEMSKDNHRRLKDFYKDSEGIVKKPPITSELYSAIYMPYIENEGMTVAAFKKVLSDVERMSKVKMEAFDIDYHLDKLELHRNGVVDADIDRCKRNLIECNLTRHASLSHSDLTLSNILVNGGEVYYIDALYERSASTYLNDYAKLLMSLDGYEEIFHGAKRESVAYEALLMDAIKGIEREVFTLEYMWAIRLNNYHEDKTRVRYFVKKVGERLA